MLGLWCPGDVLEVSGAGKQRNKWDNGLAVLHLPY